jgi:hypothetical protein
MTNRHEYSNRLDHTNEAANVLEELGGKSHTPGRTKSASCGHHPVASPDDQSNAATSPANTQRDHAITLDSLPEEGVTPDWLDPFIQGELDIEDTADRIADEIRRDPRLTRRVWWQRFIARLVAVAPERLISMAEALTDLRSRLQHQELKR